VLRLTLVRHGSTEWNQTGRFQGWGDPPLSAQGRAEAERLRGHLANETFDRVVASDLVRARETAAIALPGASVETDPRLREMSFGTWDGLTWDECVARDGDLIRRWSDDPAAVDPPGGEALADFEARIAAALGGLPEEGSHLWVVHAGVIHAILARWMDVPLRRTFALHISACGITRAEIFPGGGARVTCVNEGVRP
jgi:alpha-ribazole phosphatase/probable phosphoglycerate mutase